MFVKSWPKSKADGEDFQRIFTPALLLFFCGISKCVCKPWDLKRVSVNSLVDSSSGSEGNGESDMNSLQDYVGAATQHFEASHGRGRLHQETSDSGGGEDDSTCKAEEIWKPYNLCIDLAPPYSGRLSCLKHLVRSNPDTAHRLVKSSLSATFHQLYTKESLKLHDISHLVFTNNAALNRWKVLTSARGLRTVAAATGHPAGGDRGVPLPRRQRWRGPPGL